MLQSAVRRNGMRRAVAGAQTQVRSLTSLTDKVNARMSGYNTVNAVQKRDRTSFRDLVGGSAFAGLSDKIGAMNDKMAAAGSAAAGSVAAARPKSENSVDLSAVKGLNEKLVSFTSSGIGAKIMGSVSHLVHDVEERVVEQAHKLEDRLGMDHTDVNSELHKLYLERKGMDLNPIEAYKVGDKKAKARDDWKLTPAHWESDYEGIAGLDLFEGLSETNQQQLQREMSEKQVVGAVSS